MKNFRYATAIPGDIDNKNIANPMEQQTHDAVSARLKKRRINHCIYSSRNDNKSKDGRTARPKFHVLLPLSEPLTDGKKYLGFCGWFIREFNGDPHVKGLTQKLFGFGGHPNPVILFYQDGLCIDEVLTDDDLFVNTPSPVGPPQRTATRVTSNLKLPLDKPRSR